MTYLKESLLSLSKKEIIEVIRQFSTPREPLPTGLEPDQKCIQPIKAVLFDIYGTLLQSASGDIGFNVQGRKEILFKEALQASDLSPITDCCARGMELFHQAIKEAHTERKKEKGVHFPEVEIYSIWKSILYQLYREKRIKTDPSERQIKLMAIHYELRINPVWPMPGAKTVVCKLKERGYRLGIVSNAQFYTPLALEALLQASPYSIGFDEQICFWSYQHLEAKPSSRLFELAAKVLKEKHNISTKETLYVGNDKRNDIATPKRLGFRTALFAGDKYSLRLYEDNLQIKTMDPDCVITQLSQITDLL